MALLPTDPAKQRIVVIGMVPILLFAAFWYFLHGKLREQVSELEVRLEELEIKNEVARQEAMQSGPELERRLALYERHMERLERLIPSSEEVADLLHDITAQARDIGVELTSVRPQGSSRGPYYNQQSYQLAVVGGYHEVARYLAAIGSMPRIITPVDVRLSGAGSSEDPGTIQASFRIQTYVIPRAQPRPPAAAGAGGQ